MSLYCHLPNRIVEDIQNFFQGIYLSKDAKTFGTNIYSKQNTRITGRDNISSKRVLVIQTKLLEYVFGEGEVILPINMYNKPRRRKRVIS